MRGVMKETTNVESLPPFFAMDNNSLLFLLNRHLNTFTRCLSVRLIHGLAVLVLAGGSVSAWAQAEPVDPVADFCDLVMVGGSNGSSCAALAEAADSTARVSYEPAENPWRLGEGPTADSGQALFSADVGSGESSCLRLRLGEGRQLVETNLLYTVDAGTSDGALTILLERGGEADTEEILRASVEAVWATLRHTVDLRRPPVVGISICYEKGSGIDASLDRAGVDNIRLETLSSLADFCDLVVAGGSGGSNCAALAEDEVSGAKVSYEPAEHPWRLGEGPTADSGQALFSAALGSGESSCLRLRLNEGRQLVETNLRYIVDAGDSTGTLTILLERGGEADAEEILRASGTVAWTSMKHTVDLGQSPIVGISICYEKGSGIDAGLDWAGVDNIQLDTVEPVAEFCDLVVAGGSGGSNCAVLAEDEVSGAKVSYEPAESFWRAGDGNSDQALFSGAVSSGESSCLRLRLQLNEMRRLVTINFAYTVVSAGTSTSALTISLERDGEENELILRRSTPESEWIEFEHAVNLDGARVSGLLACYQQGAMEGSALDRAGLDDLSFVYEYVYDRDEFCDVAVQGGRSGENCEWIRAVQSDSVDELWRDSASFIQRGARLVPSWAVVNLGFNQESCLRLLLQPRLDSSALAGLSFDFRPVGLGNRYEFRIQRVGQRNFESIRDIVQPNQITLLIESYTSDLDLASGLISSFIVCYSLRNSRPAQDVVQFVLNAIQFEDEVIAVSMLGSTLPPRLFHFAQRPQSVDFAVQVLSQFGTVIDAAMQTTLTVRSGVAGMQLSLAVPETGQSASGEGEVSLPLSFSGEQNVVLGFDIPFAVADGTTLAVTVSTEEEAIAGESHELALFDFCGLVVRGGRDDEDADLQRSCSDFAQAVSALRFDPPDKPWRLGEGPTEDSGQALFSAELDSGESSCMRLRLSEDQQLFATRIGYTVDAGTSAGGLTISLERDGEAGENILRESGEVSWATLRHKVALGRSRVVGISICYEKGSGGEDAGLDWAGVDNIRLEPADPVADFCDLVMADGRGGSSCAALAEAAESTAGVSYEPAENPWRVGDGPTVASGQALFSAGVDSGESSCLRLQFRDGRQLLAVNFAYTVSAGTSNGVLTIALRRAGEADEEVLRQSGEQDWTEMQLPIAISGRQPVEGVSICYEKGSGGGDAGLDWAGVDNIQLEPVDPVTNFCELVMAGGSGGSSCATLAEAAESTARVSYDPAASPWRVGDGPTENSGRALFSAAVGSDDSSCLRLRLRPGDGRQLVAVNFAYTVSAGASNGALTIALHRAGEPAEEVLRQSGEQDWTEMQLPTAIPDRQPVEGVSICYEKGSGGEDAGLDWAGVDNIRLETASPLMDFCDLVIQGGSDGSSCVALAEDEDSGARVSYDPAESPWRLGEGPPEGDFGQALFSAAVEPAGSSCLRLQLNEGRQLLAVNFWYSVAAGTSTGALTIALERDGEADEEILRESGEVAWTTRAYTVNLGKSPVAGISICYEKGSGIGAGLDLAGVDNIRLDSVGPADLVAEFCDLVVEGGSDGSSCTALAEAAESSARVSYVPAESPWRLGEGPTADFGLALFSAAVDSGESSCLRLRLNEGRQLVAANFWYTVDAGTSTGALTISLERDGEPDGEEILRASGEVGWTSKKYTVDLRRPPVVGISICYEKGSGIEAGLDRAGVDNIRLETASPLVDFCDLVMADGSGGSSCAALAEDEGRVSYEPAESPWRLGEGPPEEDFGPALFSAAIEPAGSSCLRLRLDEGRQLVETNFWYTVAAGDSTGALTISLERDGEAAEEILRESDEVAWATESHTVALNRSRVVSISICYEKGSGGDDAGLDRAGVDNIQLETVAPLADFCDLVLVDGRRGTSCAMLAEDEGSGAKVSYIPAGSLWRGDDGPDKRSGLALFSAAIGPDESSCLRLQLRERRQLVSLNFDYTVSAGDSTGALTIALHRDGEADEEILRRSGELGWTEMLLRTATPGRLPVEGVSICYEKGADSANAGLDRAGVDNIRLGAVEPLVQFCDLAMAGGNSGRSCGVLAEVGDRIKVEYQPADSPWLVSDRPMNQGLALFSVPIDSGASSCLRLSLLELPPGRRLGVLSMDYMVSAGTSTGALTIALHRDEEADEEILRESGEMAWATAGYMADLNRSRVVGISICYERGSGGGDVGLNWAGVDNIRLDTVAPLAEFCDLVVAGGNRGSSCAALAEDEGSGAKVSYSPPGRLWRGGDGPTENSGLALFSSVVGAGESSCLRLQLRERLQLVSLNFAYTVSAGTSTGALTIALHRTGAADEEVLRRSGELGWTEMLLPTATPGRLPVEGISICYEKGADSANAGLDLAGVDNIRLDTAEPLAQFCDLAVVGGSSGRGCGVLAVGADNAKVEYRPADSPWLVSNRPMNKGLALFSAVIDTDENSCLRLSLELSPGQLLGALNMDYTVSTGTLTILLERGEEAPEEILRAGEQPWTGLQHSVNPNRGQVSAIFMCYEKSTAIEDASLAWAGVDNIELLAANPVADFCDVAVAGGRNVESCMALDVVDGFRVSYTPQQSPWVLGSDVSGSGLALFSADVGPGEDSCLQLRFPERHALRQLFLDYRALSEESGGILTIQLQRDGEEDELILRPSSLESEWAEFRHVVNLDRAQVSGLLACYQQGAMAGSTPDRAGLDDLRFVYGYLYDRNEFCDSAVEGGSAGENCKWIRSVQSNPTDRLWGDSSSLFGRRLIPSWALSEQRSSRDCLRLLLQPRLDSSLLAGLSFNFHTFRTRDGYEFHLQRVGQLNSRRIRAVVQPEGGGLPPETYTSNLDMARGLISGFIVCYNRGRSFSFNTVQFALNALQFQSEAATVSRLRSTLPPRLLQFARQSQSVDFAIQALSQFNTVIDLAVQTTLTARSGVAGMRLSLTVPETGQSASGEGEVSLPLSFNGEQNVVLGFNIPLAVVDGTTLVVTVSGNAAVAGESRELQLFDFCGLTVHGGRDSEGDEGLRQSCSDFTGAISAVYFDPPDKPWQVAAPSSFTIDNSVSQLAPNGQTSTPTKPWRAPEQLDLRLYSPPLEYFEKSCMHLQLNRLAIVTGFSLYWFLTSAHGDDFTISLGRADTNGEDEVLHESGWVESWAPFSHTVSSGRLSRMSFCYERTAPAPREGSGAGVDNLRLEYTPLPPAEFTGDEAVTKEDLLLALRAVGDCSDSTAREDCIANKLSALVANLGLGTLDARMASISEALLALNSTVTRSAYDIDRSGAVDEVDFRVLLRYLAGLRGAALVETEGGDPPDEFILRAILGR